VRKIKQRKTKILTKLRQEQLGGDLGGADGIGLGPAGIVLKK
jgi:hypothetical protein